MKYVRQQPQASDYWGDPFRPHLDVADSKPVNTGLIWSDGTPIIRLPNPIGFGRDEEW